VFFRSSAPVQKGTPIFLFSAVTLEKFAKLSISASNPLHIQGRNQRGDPGVTTVTPKFSDRYINPISIRGEADYAQHLHIYRFCHNLENLVITPLIPTYNLPPLPFFYCTVHQNHTPWSKCPIDVQTLYGISAF
jgi:hypothetical protein